MYEKQINEARSLATLVPHAITAVDTTPWMMMQYVPDLGTGAAAATVAVEAGRTTMTILVDAAVPAGKDAIGNSTGLIDLSSSTYDTMGELVDYINGKLAWRAYLVGAIRSDAVASLLAKTAASCFGANGLVFYSDTSVSKDVSIAISGEKFVNNGINGHVTDAGDQCENSMQYANINVTCASAPYLRYYTGKQGSTEVQLGSDLLLVTATAKEQGEASFAETFITATRGERLIVRAIGTSAVALSAPVFKVLGKTAVLKNDRIVDEVNY